MSIKLLGKEKMKCSKIKANVFQHLCLYAFQKLKYKSAPLALESNSLIVFIKNKTHESRGRTLFFMRKRKESRGRILERDFQLNQFTRITKNNEVFAIFGLLCSSVTHNLRTAPILHNSHTKRFL